MSADVQKKHDDLLGAKAQARVNAKSHADPLKNTNFLPKRSAIRPKRTRRHAELKAYADI